MGRCMFWGKHWDVLHWSSTAIGFYFSSSETLASCRGCEGALCSAGSWQLQAACVEPLNAEPQVHGGHTRRECSSVVECLLSL